MITHDHDSQQPLVHANRVGPDVHANVLRETHERILDGRRLFDVRVDQAADDGAALSEAQRQEQEATIIADMLCFRAECAVIWSAES